MKPKCPWYINKNCGNPNDCVFKVAHYHNINCRKGGLLKTPNKLRWMENES